MNYDSEEETIDFMYDDSSECDTEDITLDYELAQMIQRKVAGFSVEKTREQLHSSG